MAAKKKAKTSKKAKGKEKAQAKTIELVSEATLTSLLKSCLQFQNQISDKSGAMGSMIRAAAEEKGLHRGAFNAIKGLYRMGKKDPSKLWLHLCHFDDMRAKAGLDAMAGEQGQLFNGGEKKTPAKAKASSKEKEPAAPPVAPEEETTSVH